MTVVWVHSSYAHCRQVNFFQLETLSYIIVIIVHNTFMSLMVVTFKGTLILYHIETHYHHNQSLIFIIWIIHGFHFSILIYLDINLLIDFISYIYLYFRPGLSIYIKIFLITVLILPTLDISKLSQMSLS